VRGAGGGGRGQAVEVVCSLPGSCRSCGWANPVRVDEGSLCAVVEETDGQATLARVVRTGPNGARLRADEGLNFPDTELRLSPLTAKDLRDLDTVAEIADIVAYSFVQRPSDIELLQAELAARTDRQLGLIAKIETGNAVRSLPKIIVQAAPKQPIAVMIARGDLARGRPHPVIWATQVLDTFLHKGLHSRAEMTDAAMAERAECVTLNKGPHLADAVAVLDDVLGRLEGHQAKKTTASAPSAPGMPATTAPPVTPQPGPAARAARGRTEPEAGYRDQRRNNRTGGNCTAHHGCGRLGGGSLRRRRRR